MGAVVVPKPLRPLPPSPNGLWSASAPGTGDVLDRLDPWGWDGLGDFVIEDQELVEEGLVEHAPGDRRGQAVRPARVVEELEGLFECLADVVGVMAGCSGPLGDLGPLASDPILLGCQDIVVDEVAVAELKQSLLFLFQGFKAACRSVGFALGALQLGLGVALHRSSDPILLGVSQPVVLLVVALDGSFDAFGSHVPGIAGVPQVVASEALEVLVASAIAGDRAVQQSAAALAAEDRALEVLLVLARPVTAESVRPANFPNPLKRLPINDRRLLPFGLGTVVGDDADVVLVAEHAVYCASSQRRSRTLGRHRRAQPSSIE